MMFYDATEEIKETAQAVSTPGPYRLAEVIDVEFGKPLLRFSGEKQESQKEYKFLASYAPQARDKVLLARMGKTYIILGKIV